MILEKGNKFSEIELNILSEQIFSFFYIDVSDKNKTISSADATFKGKLLKSFIKSFNQILQTKVAPSDIEKVQLIKIINKLKLQQELFEFLSSSDEINHSESLKNSVNRMGDKSQSSLKDL